MMIYSPKRLVLCLILEKEYIIFCEYVQLWSFVPIIRGLQAEVLTEGNMKYTQCVN